MRFYETLPETDATRIITRFLFLPRNIGKEWRWLEIAKIKQSWNGWFRQYKWIMSPIWKDIEFIATEKVKSL